VGLFIAIFVLGSLYASYLFYVTLRAIVANTELPSLPALTLPRLRIPLAQAAEGTPEAAVEFVPPEDLSPELLPGGAVVVQPPEEATMLNNPDRINILLLGIDRRSGNSWGHLTDTIIIVTVDRANKTVGMLSIPRDLYLPIPGVGENRVNTANVFGAKNDYPGGGTALLKRTIEANFGIPIDYYVMIDFQGFKKIIDGLGGVDINVPRAIHDTKYPDPRPGDPYHFTTVHFEPGFQHMDGTRALQYARSRMSTSDFDRADRQQKVLLAIREKALSLGLIPKLPTLLPTLAGSFKTDMSVGDMMEMARLGPQIDLGNMKSVIVKPPLVYGHRTAAGAAVQLPVWDKINPVVADLFSAPLVVQPTATLAPPTPTPTTSPAQIQVKEEVAREGARIAVQNGTAQPNFAARVAALLMQEGFQVVEFGDAARVDYGQTVIMDYSGKSATLKLLVDKFHVTPENVRRSPNVNSPVDIRIIVGQDFVLPEP
jgi:LCP family protein required for cell wall assembly